MFAILFAAAAMAADPAESITVTVVGTLKTGLVAIGGETTGATITANGVTWEVDCGKDEQLRMAAEKLSGKQVRLSGKLERRKGIEVPERWIVHVASLQAAEDDKPGKRSPEFEATAERKDTKLGLMLKEGELIVDVVSDSGIGGAKLKRFVKSWPAGVHVRLHLKGLEQFSAGSGETSARWSVSNDDSHVSRMALLKGKQATAVEPDSREYTAAKFIPPNPNDPADKGYFEIGRAHV